MGAGGEFLYERYVSIYIYESPRSRVDGRRARRRAAAQNDSQHTHTDTPSAVTSRVTVRLRASGPSQGVTRVATDTANSLRSVCTKIYELTYARYIAVVLGEDRTKKEDGTGCELDGAACRRRPERVREKTHEASFCMGDM